MVLEGKRLTSPQSERKKSILGNLDKWTEEGGDLPNIFLEQTNDYGDTSDGRSSFQHQGSGHLQRKTPISPLPSSPRKKSINKMTVRISKKRDIKESGSFDEDSSCSSKPKTPKPKSPIKLCRRSVSSQNISPRKSRSSISSNRHSTTTFSQQHEVTTLSTSSAHADLPEQPRRKSLEEESESAPLPPPPPPFEMDSGVDASQCAAKVVVNHTSDDIPESPSIRQRIALLQENLTTPKAGSRKAFNRRNTVAEIQYETNRNRDDAPKGMPAVPFASEIDDTSSSAPKHESSALSGPSTHSVKSFADQQSPSGSPRKMKKASLSRFWQESTSRQNDPRDLSISVHSAISCGAEAKERALAREMETISRLRKTAVVSELIGKFSLNPNFKVGWEFEETTADMLGSTPSRWNSDQRPSSHGNETEEQVAVVGLEQLREESLHSHDTAGTGTATYEEASSVEDLQPVNDSLQGDLRQRSTPHMSTPHISSNSVGNSSTRSEHTGDDTHEEASIQLDSSSVKAASHQSSGGGDHALSLGQTEAGNTSDKGESSFASYTMEAPFAPQTPHNSTQALHESNRSMFAMHDSFQLNTPAAQTNTVFLDFREMERGPSLEVKNQKAKVITDLKSLMERTKQEKQSSKTRRRKEKMLRDLLETLTKVNGDNEDDSGPTVKNLTVEEVSDIVTHINLCEQTNTPIRWDLIGDIIFPDGIKDESDDEVVLVGGSNLPREGKQVRAIDKTVSFASKCDTASAAQSSVPHDTYSLFTHDVVADEDPTEMFRKQYNLREEEMNDVIAHLDLCEETGTPIRWDLIHRIIYPEDDLVDLPGGDADDCKSAITDGFDDESRASWFSIYPEFDDCASSVTFLVEGDEIKIGKKSKMHTSINAPPVVEEV